MFTTEVVSMLRSELGIHLVEARAGGSFGGEWVINKHAEKIDQWLGVGIGRLNKDRKVPEKKTVGKSRGWNRS